MDGLHCGRTIVERIGEILQKIDEDRLVSSHNIVASSIRWVEYSLTYKSEYKRKLGAWISQELKVKNLIDTISIYEN